MLGQSKSFFFLFFFVCVVFCFCLLFCLLPTDSCHQCPPSTGRKTETDHHHQGRRGFRASQRGEGIKGSRGKENKIKNKIIIRNDNAQRDGTVQQATEQSRVQKEKEAKIKQRPSTAIVTKPLAWVESHRTSHWSWTFEGRFRPSRSREDRDQSNSNGDG